MGNDLDAVAVRYRLAEARGSLLLNITATRTSSHKRLMPLTP